MKIKELLELSQHESLEDVAKNHLTIGVKRARIALKAAGCYNKIGVKGWHYDGDPATLERSIYDFVMAPTRKSPSNNVKASNSKIKSNSNNDSDEDSNNASNNASNNVSNNDIDMKVQIKALITGKQDSKPNKTYKGIYFDDDIASFLDNVQHGNKSELVNKIMRAYLIENDLI